MKRRKMFFQMIWRASLRRKGATLLALVSVTIAACVATALLGLYADMESKISREFRGFGASLVVVAKDGQVFDPESINSAKAKLGSNATLIPVSYVVAKTASGKPIVVVGTDIQQAKKLNSYWSVEGSGDALVGERAKKALAGEESQTLTFNGKALALASAAILKTGGDEDSRIYLPLDQLAAWTGLQPNTLEVGVNGKAADIESAAATLKQALPSADVRPIRQVAEAEAHILSRTRAVFLGCMATIVAVVGLCVFATLTASVFERRKDYAVMKALGSTQRGLNALFLAETGSLGIVGGITGFVLGTGLAMLIGRLNFNASVAPRIDVLPAVLGGCIALTLVAALFPLLRLQNLAPATMLKGD
jgi:putative ABC transport system permease protein